MKFSRVLLAAATISIFSFGLSVRASQCSDVFASKASELNHEVIATQAYLEKVAQAPSALIFSEAQLVGAHLDAIEQTIVRNYLGPAVWSFAKLATTHAPVVAAPAEPGRRPKAMTKQDRLDMQEQGLGYLETPPAPKPSEDQARRAGIARALFSLGVTRFQVSPFEHLRATYNDRVGARADTPVTEIQLRDALSDPLSFANLYAETHKLYARAGGSGQVLRKAVPVIDFDTTTVDLAHLAHELPTTPEARRRADNQMLELLRSEYAPYFISPLDVGLGD